MKKICIFIVACCTSIGIVNAAVRDTHTNRSAPPTKTISNRNQNSLQSIRTTATVTSRDNTRTTTPVRTTTNKNETKTSRSAISQKIVSTPTNGLATRPQQQKTVRASIMTNSDLTFGSGYNTCRDAYFTCMDQFCAKQSESYRRCACSSRLPEIQSRERALSAAADNLTDFKNLNIEVINKTSAEVKAMISATDGEEIATSKKDKSDAANQLQGISAVLAKTKGSALSTQGQLDIAGDIKEIWATTELTGGANIANLTGKALYNAVHAQCMEMMTTSCPNSATQNMVTSAYGMYIENDCSTLINELDKKLSSANSAIRDTEREMHVARLENYDAHNSVSINDCIANVRSDITADTACGRDFVHCLDITGLYLYRDTGEPIYSPNFYHLEDQISLSGDILKNQSNRLIVAELNNKRAFANTSLKKCTDLSDNVWDEFMRQAIREIYQGQQERVRKVKDECLSVVNQCYDEQTRQLKDFSNIKDQLVLGQRLELSEEMCQDKLNTCSNLYGNMDLLLTAMHNITNQKIANECITTLQEYAKDLCTPPANDALHTYPFACRTYIPGDQYCETNPQDSACINYNSSLYKKIVSYAMDACVRPSESTLDIPLTILADVNTVMTQLRIDINKSLVTECERMGGTWVSGIEWIDNEGGTEDNGNPTPDNIHDITKQIQLKQFTKKVNSNNKWGFCAEPDDTSSKPDDTSSN